jgi:hypothetical protein
MVPMQEGVTVHLDRPRQISLDLWAGYEAERELERLLGQPVGSVQLLRDFALQTLSMTQLLVLLTCGLRRYDATLTLEQVGKMVPLGRLTYVLNTVLAAWEQGMTPDDQEITPVAPGEDKALAPPSFGGMTSGAGGNMI